MAPYSPSIPEDLAEWAMRQPLFWTASAPRAGKHINLSPKGYATFTVLGPNLAAYLDQTGSGAETAAHLHENGRITIGWCSYDKSPRIMRIWCKGRVLELGTTEFEDVVGKMREVQKRLGVELGHGENLGGVRAIVLLEVFKCGTSCGYGVPVLNGSFTERPALDKWSSRMVQRGELTKYRTDWNVRSLDGLTGLRQARREKGEWLIVGDVVAWLKMMWGLRDAVLFGIVLGVLVVLLLGRIQAMGWVKTLVRF
ncbi:pyridoxamine phosphate oxidase family protein [Calocera viscosa TUFC12733]|uniref:Pyridoxamine phosphate oxidase family protein n=1 Tax=Calocera viscosa (strain TUFC12733) TaxID=1330018 RepID=A0A167MED0_CALVF|nr:pyridoxamine phosphate oxidase family protein [Calocera viscosa TUFC12733]